MNRRDMLRTTVSGVAVCTLTGAAMLEEGCTTGDALAQLNKWLPVGIQAFAGVVAIINPAAGSVLAVAVTTAKALWADVSAAVAAYNAAPAASKATVLGKVETALGALISGLPDVLKQIPGGAEYANTVTAAIDLVLATLSAIDANLGGVPPVAQATATARTAKITKAATNGADFKKQFNQILANGGYSKYAVN